MLQSPRYDECLVALNPRSKALRILLWLALGFAALISTRARGDVSIIDLRGDWAFALSGPEPTFPQGALPPLAFSDRIELPGTTETRGKGPLNADRDAGRLTRVRKFEGPAWYQRVVDIPAVSAGKALELLLERTRYTQVWWDGQPCGEQRWYTGPQRYSLPAATPGRHTLTVMVDNRDARRPLRADPHEYSDHTQTNWNGIIGRIELTAEPAVSIDDIRITGDLAQRAFLVETSIKVRQPSSDHATVRVSAHSTNHSGRPHQPPAQVGTVALGTDARLTLTLPLGNDARTWDEFSPALYVVTVRVETNGAAVERTVTTGLRQLTRQGTQLAVNGRTTFLRGKHDACVFPLTGHPPMDVAGWLEYFGKLRQYGINHVRCHTWTPPEAAFAAADQLGIYLQPELPFWGTFTPEIRAALTEDALRILREYGNHPSFVMFTLGNELGGDRALMNAMVEELRKSDPRRWYADGSNNHLWNPEFQPSNEFFATARAKTPRSGGKSVPARGSYFYMDGLDGPVQWGSGATVTDLRDATEGIPVPVIGHETGQYTIYPDFREIARYTGVLEARNLERFRTGLAANGMLDQADAFFRASGALAASLYKEEIELALRTPGFGGFQLLDLQDYPGQGTALVGILNAFMESKGLITEEAWRNFCAPVVPLARFERQTWTSGERYRAAIDVAQYGPDDLHDTTVHWAIVTAAGESLRRGAIGPATLAQGGLRSVGNIDIALPSVDKAVRLELQVTITSAAKRWTNTWPLWLYPARQEVAVPESVALVRTWTEAKPLLQEGRAVVLVTDAAQSGDTVAGAYATDFWCWPMFLSSPGTMGLLIDATHAALAGFPTATHAERQWTTIMQAARPVILTSQTQLKPMVQVIDNLARNEKLGLIFEARVGSRGRLLVCASNLLALQDQPEGRQLLQSLLRHASDAHWRPQSELTETDAARLFTPSLARGAVVTASSHHQPPWGAVPKPENVMDDNINSGWTPAKEDKNPWIQIQLAEPQSLSVIQTLWAPDVPETLAYRVETSLDGTAWQSVAQCERGAGPRQVHPCDVTARFVRVTLLGDSSVASLSLRDLRLVGK